MVYEGSFMNFLLNGKGRILLPSGNIIEGNFNNGLLNGKGSYLFSDGSKHKLTFSKGYNECNGIYINIYRTLYFRGWKEGIWNASL